MKTLDQIRGRKKVVFTFGRMNPPSRGHSKVVEKVFEVAKKEKAEPRIYVSFTQDPKKNPLTRKQKIKYLKLGIPGISEYIVENSSIKTLFDVVYSLQREGFTDLFLVVGDDRVKEFETRIKTYINHPDKEKNLAIEKFSVINVGKRENFSASLSREAAKNGNFQDFKHNSPEHLSEIFCKEMYDLVRAGLKIAEDIIKLKGTLGIPREEMPQIKNNDIDEFLKDLKNDGISVSKKTININLLKPSQNEINLEKIKEKIEDINSGNMIIKPFIVSSDNYILDGHHQLYALKSINKNNKVDAYVVDLSMRDLLSHAHNFPSVSYKTIHE